MTAEITTTCAKRTVHSAHAWTNAFGSHDCLGVKPDGLMDTGTLFYSPAPGTRPLSELDAAFQAQTVENLSNELCQGAEPDQPTVTQDELLTALDELLDSALHDDACYIHENDTECVCVIGKVRAALPPCGATYRPAHPQRGDRVVQCHRNAHPASPDRHVF